MGTANINLDPAEGETSSNRTSVPSVHNECRFVDTSADEGLVSSQMRSNDDIATCIIDLRKVRNQYEVWQSSFKGSYTHARLRILHGNITCIYYVFTNQAYLLNQALETIFLL